MVGLLSPLFSYPFVEIIVASGIHLVCALCDQEINHWIFVLNCSLSA